MLKCKGCTTRYVGCHGACVDYLEYDKKNKKRRMENLMSGDLYYDSTLKRRKHKVLKDKLR